MLSIGLVFLDDLHSFGTWISDRAPVWIRERGLNGSLLAPTSTPPPITIVVARSLHWSMLETSAAWLRLAERVIIVLDPKDDVATEDPDVAELSALQQGELNAALDGRVTFIKARLGALESAIDEALRLARETNITKKWAPMRPLALVPAVEPGEWIDWNVPRHSTLPLECAEVLRLLAPALCRPNRSPAVLDGLEGTRIDLRTGARERVENLAGAAHLWHPIAATPDGKQWLRTTERHAYRMEGATLGPLARGGYGPPIGIDPTGQIAWAGGRCHFHFRILTEHGPAFWTPSNHDWPCGHGKKLYGYKDNDPLFVHLAPDVSACLSTYEHDTLLTPQLPLVWRDVGGFAVAERTRGEPRALFFCRSDADDVFPGDPFEADEDARDEYAVVTLGPSKNVRYAVSLEKPTYRLAKDRVERLGGPLGGWIVCNDEHEIVRRAAGRLLGGFGPWVVVEEAGNLFRENLMNGHREKLGVVEQEICAAVSLAGTPNAALVHLQGERVRLKLV